MFMQQIPDDIFEIIFTFLSSEKSEQILQLISVNSYFHHKFLRSQRKLEIVRPESVRRYLLGENQEIITSKISQPTKQVTLRINDVALVALYRQRDEIQIRSELELNHLVIGYPPLTHWIVPAFKRIRSMTLIKPHVLDKSNLPTTLSSDIMQIIEQKYQSSEGFGLQLLSISDYDESISLLPFFPKLTSLNFTLAVQLTSLTLLPYQSLHSLDLFDCPTVTDVSMLRNIVVLSIRSCLNIEDVSSLTNNYSISIECCPKVKNHLTGFGRNSSKITIIANQPISVDPSLFTKATYLLLDAHLQGNYKLALPSSPYLRSFSLVWNQFRFDQMYQHLRHVVLASYDYIQKTQSQNENLSFHILGNIVHLELQRIIGLRNLIGLGQEKQKVVELIDCVDIIDFTAIRAVPKVRIENCKGLEDCVQLDQVEHLIISKCSQFIENIGNSKVLKHLELYSWRTCCLSSMRKELKIFELNNCYLEIEKNITEGNHRKIVFRNIWYNPTQFDKLTALLGDRYEIQRFSEDFTVVFLLKGDV